MILFVALRAETLRNPTRTLYVLRVYALDFFVGLSAFAVLITLILDVPVRNSSDLEAQFLV